MQHRKRTPSIEPHLAAWVAKISKADWIELFRQLYTDHASEDMSDYWFADALRRHEILLQQRQQ